MSDHTSSLGDARPGARPSTIPLTPLFVPAHEPRKVAKAMACGVDAIILDLEASVPMDRKDEARRAVNSCVAVRPEARPAVWVRVNEAGCEFEADVTSIDWAATAGAVVAHAEDADALRTLDHAGARGLLPLIESVAGFSALESMAAVPRVERFAIGTWDLLLDLGLLAVTDPDQSELIWQLRGELVIQSRRFGLAAPIDGVYARLDDDAGLRAVSERVKRLGFGGKLLIHPRQIPVATAVFGDGDVNLASAREIVEAYEAALANGQGAIRLRGLMIDRPMFERARMLLASRSNAEAVANLTGR